MSELQSEVEVLREKASAIESSPQGVEAAAMKQRLEDGLRAHVSRESMFAAERAMLVARNTALTDTVTSLRASVSELEAKLAHTAREHDADAQRSMQASQTREQHASVDDKASLANIDDLNAVIASANKQLVDADASLKRLREQCERLQQETSAAVQAKTATDAVNAGLQREVNALLSKVSESVNAVRCARGDADSARAQASKSLKQADVLMSELHAVSDAAGAAKRADAERIRELSNEVALLQSKLGAGGHVSALSGCSFGLLIALSTCCVRLCGCRARAGSVTRRTRTALG